jgi:hypothetical protein
MTTKVCKGCGVERELTEYEKIKGGYYAGKCKVCKAARKRINRAKRRDLLLEDTIKCTVCEEYLSRVMFLQISEGVFHVKCIACCKGVEHFCSTCSTFKPITCFHYLATGEIRPCCKECKHARNNLRMLKKRELEIGVQICIICEQSKVLTLFRTMPDNTKYQKCYECCKGVEHFCGTCEVVKDINCFYIKGKGVPRKDCYNQKVKTYVSKNLEKVRARNYAYRRRPEVITRARERGRLWYSNPDNRKRKQELANINERKKYADKTSRYHISKLLRGRFGGMIKKEYKRTSVMNLLGCTFEHYKLWMSYQFDENMNWDNSGTYWVVDHIKPLASFDLSQLSEQKKAFHWTNLQPLEAIANMEKHTKYTDEIKANAAATLAAFSAEYDVADFININFDDIEPNDAANDDEGYEDHDEDYVDDLEEATLLDICLEEFEDEIDIDDVTLEQNRLDALEFEPEFMNYEDQPHRELIDNMGDVELTEISRELLDNMGDPDPPEQPMHNANTQPLTQHEDPAYEAFLQTLPTCIIDGIEYIDDFDVPYP